jgi:hypothetical protein
MLYENGAQLSGSAAPAGTWRGVNFAGCTYLHLIQGTATLENVYIPDGLEGGRTAYFVGYEDAPPQTLKPWQGITRALGFYTDRNYTTIGGAGHKGQEIEIGPSGQNATLVHGTNLRLKDGANFRYLVGDVIRFKRDDTTPTVWHETYRSENVPRAAGVTPASVFLHYGQAADISSADGSSVSTLTDRGSTGGTFVVPPQGGTRTAPTVQTVNGQRVIRCNGSTQALWKANAAIPASYVVLVRASFASFGNYNPVLWSNGPNGSMRFCPLLPGGRWGYYANTGADVMGDVVLAANVPYTLGFGWNNATGTATLYFNGLVVGTSSLTPLGGGDRGSDNGLYLATDGEGFARSQAADIYKFSLIGGVPSRDTLNAALRLMETPQ